jgi:AraC-like DNA-binding protein
MVRTIPTNRAVFVHAKIVHAMAGAVDIETAQGTSVLLPGMSLALGSGQWCRIKPQPRVRLWTVYIEEDLLRLCMARFLPDPERVRAGLHPGDWDGRPIVMSPGLPVLHRVEPIWRQLSVLRDGDLPPEVVAVRSIELFARWVGVVLPTFVTSEHSAEESSFRTPIEGRLTDSSVIGQTGKAARLLREHMEQPWTASALARAVALSRSQLTRMFVIRTGIAPMRFLTEVRLTEFTRLIEETDLSVALAARKVGWRDARVASSWFSRRYGATPSQYRTKPHPHCANHVG